MLFFYDAKWSSEPASQSALNFFNKCIDIIKWLDPLFLRDKSGSRIFLSFFAGICRDSQFRVLGRMKRRKIGSSLH